MPLLLLLLGVSVFAYAWVARRGSTLTRACKWRLDRRLGPNQFHCIACNARTESGNESGRGRSPRLCLRDQRSQI